jgi:hypothetical protein
MATLVFFAVILTALFYQRKRPAVRYVVTSFCLTSIFLTINALCTNIVHVDATLTYWPDSNTYTETIRNLQARIDLSNLSWSELVNVVGSNNFFYPTLLALSDSWSVLPLSVEAVSLNIVAISITSVLALEMYREAHGSARLNGAHQNVKFFTFCFLISTSGIFWGVFLLKDALVMCLVVAYFYFVSRRQWWVCVYLLVALFTLRHYLVPLVVASTITAYMLNRTWWSQYLLLKVLIAAVVALASVQLLFLYKDVAMFYMENNSDWVEEQGRNRSFLFNIARQLIEPVFPGEEVYSSLYNYFFWKLILLSFVGGMVFSQASRRFALSEHLRGPLIFVVILLVLYALFPRFANFRHRLPIEPIIFIFGFYTLTLFAKRLAKIFCGGRDVNAIQ